MQIWQAIILGFTQGLTEFLPVSSSGHLTLMQKLLGVSEDNYMFLNVMLHVGTLIPVIVVFFKEILNFFDIFYTCSSKIKTHKKGAFA